MYINCPMNIGLVFLSRVYSHSITSFRSSFHLFSEGIHEVFLYYRGPLFVKSVVSLRLMLVFLYGAV